MFSIHVGDQIKLISPMGVFRAVGTVCTIDRVEGETIWFSCEFPNGGGNGCISMDEFHKYFQKIEESTQGIAAIEEDTIIELVKIIPNFPYDVGERFIVEAVAFGGATFSHVNGGQRSFTMSMELVYDHFNVVIPEGEAVETEELPDKITKEYVEEMLKKSEFQFMTAFEKAMLCACKLPNGMVISSCHGFATPDQFDRDVGKAKCIEYLMGKVWEMETYVLETIRAEAKEAENDPCRNTDCNECICHDLGECLFEDDDDE